MGYTTYIVFAVFPDADPIVIRRMLRNPRLLGQIQESDWGKHENVYIPDTSSVGATYVRLELVEALARATTQSYSSTDVLFTFILGEDRDDNCFILSAGGSTQRFPVRIDKDFDAYTKEFDGIITCTDDGDDDDDDSLACDGDGCDKCVDARSESYKAYRVKWLERYIRAKGLWPARKFVHAHGEIVMSSLTASSGLPLDLCRLAADYHCISIDTPDPRQPPSEITEEDDTKEEEEDHKHFFDERTKQFWKDVTERRGPPARLFREARDLSSRNIEVGDESHRAVHEAFPGVNCEDSRI